MRMTNIVKKNLGKFDSDLSEPARMADALEKQTQMEGLKLLFTVLEKGTPEYNNAVDALMTASGVFKGNRDELS